MHKETKFKSIDEVTDIIVKNTRPGDRIFIGSGAGQPQLLVKSLMERAKWLSDTEFLNTLALGMETFMGDEFTKILRHNSFFIAPNLRQAVFEGRAEYTPAFLSQVPGLFKSGRLPIDLALIQVSPPDAHGYCSYGVSIDVTKAATECAKKVIAEVNPQMPRTLGDTFIHIDDIDILVENDTPILEYKAPELDDVSKTIGRYASQLIDNGSTIQVGLGVTASAAIPFLEDRKDLGIHTEMFTDDLINAIEAGIITNNKKTIHKGKIIASYCMGSRRLYDFVDDNPLFEFHPIDYTNNLFIIAKNYKMVSINSAFEVDLTGQACSDSLGYRVYSGLGGHADFCRGASLSKDGKSIIVIPSTALNGTVSRIVPHIQEGSGVTATRGDVHYVITEWGIAYLRGKSIRERIMSMISIAHPKFRKQLYEYAKKHLLIFQDQKYPTYEIYDQRKYETSVTLKNGQKIYFRVIKPSDEPLLREFFHTVSEETIYKRFFTPYKMTKERLERYLNVDLRKEMHIIGTIWENGTEKAVAIGTYIVDQFTDMAEFAMLIHDNWQNMGIGTILFHYLIDIARQNGVKGFVASVLPHNKRMLDIIYKSGYKVESKLEYGVYSISFRFDSKK